MRRYRLEIALALTLLASTVLVYWPACAAEFVNYDDTAYVTENARVLSGLSWGNARWALTSWHASNCHPLTWLSLQLDASVFGRGPWGFHLTNVLLHAGNAALLFGVLRLLTGALWRSATVAALFALHPLHVESVAWVSERKDVLCGLFFMLTLLAYAWYVRRPGWRRYLLVVVSFALALLSKPMAVTLPCVLLLLDWWPLRRFVVPPLGGWERPPPKGGTTNKEFVVPPSGGWEGPPPKGGNTNGTVDGRRPLVLEKVPLFAMTAVSCTITWSAQQQALGSLEIFPLWSRIGNSVLAYAAYLYKTTWPSGLVAHYAHPGHQLPVGMLAAAGLLLLGLTALALALRQRAPYVLVGWLWYVGTLVPVIGLVQVGNQAMADRYTYLPLVGIFLALTWGLADLAGSLRLPSWAEAVTAVAVLAACAVCSRAQVAHWHDTISLWEHACKALPGDPLLECRLGSAYESKGRLGDACIHYEAAHRLQPQSEMPLTVLGQAMQKRGRPEEALRLYQEALRIKPTSPETHNNIGGALEALGRWRDAGPHYVEALRLDPASAEAHTNLGAILEKQDRKHEAVRHYEEAVRLKPMYAPAHNNLGAIREDEGKWQEAIHHYQEALLVQPGLAVAHFNLAALLGKQGRSQEAVRHYQEALRLDPRLAAHGDGPTVTAQGQ